MEGCLIQLLLLVVIGVGLVVWWLHQRLDAAERRQTELDLELGQLRRRLDAGGAVARPGVPAAAPEPVAEEEPVTGEEAAPAPRAAPAPASEELPAGVPAAAPAPVAEPVPVTIARGLRTDEAPAEPEPSPAPPPPEVGEPPPAGPDRAPAAEGPPPPPTPPSAPPWAQVDWERWLGVRGAAVLGGAVLALAAILFLKFSIERGLISPAARVALGMLAGLGAVGGAELLRRRAYDATANALSGAGIVILYASVWAAHRLYDLVPLSLAFGLMVLVTAACGLLSWRHRSLVVATLGLVGGFATPLLLAAGPQNPIGLFGYILLLDVGLLALSRRMGWPALAQLGLIGTALYQALWVFAWMGAESLWLTLIVLAAFAALFAVASGLTRPADEESAGRRSTLVGGLFLPFAFAAYLAARAELGEQLLPLAGLLLLLSAAACWMARVHSLPLMAPGAAAASVAVFAVWAARTGFTAATTWEAVAVASVLAAVFRLLGGVEEAAGGRWRVPSDAARSAPLVAAAGFLLVLLIAPLGAPEGRLWPWAIGWLVLTLLLTREPERAAAGAGDLRQWVAPLAAAAQVLALGAWVAVRGLAPAGAWEVAAIAVVLAGLYHLVARERTVARPEGGAADAWPSAPLVAAAGLFLVLCLAPLAAPASGLWPWLAGWTALAALLAGRGAAPPRGYRQVVAGALFGLSLLLYYLARDGFTAPPPGPLFAALVLAVAVAFQALALGRRRGPVARDAERAAAVCPGLVLLGLMLDPGGAYLAGGLFLALGLLLAGLVALVATRLASGGLYLGAAVGLAAVHSLWTLEAGEALRAPATASVALVAQAAAVLLFTFWPLVAGRRLAAKRWALYASALAGPLWFLSLKRIFEARFGGDAIGALPLALAVVALGAALGARRLWAAAAPERRRSLVWYLAVTLAFVSVAVPLQLEREWITVGWALEGLALVALWRRLDHPGLKWLGLALLGAVTVRLIFNPAVFGYYPRSGLPIFNWLMYTYLVPAAAMLLSARVLAGLEIARLRGWEADLYGSLGRRAVGAAACGLAAVLVGFWWINLAVIDYFSVGPRLDLSFDRLPARDVSLSLAWALYALLLLAVGMARRSVGLRWLSLGFLVLAIGKVFLHDLGELQDLYRVASLVGLAVSLLLVSLAYQRFVFGRDGPRQEGAET